MGVKAHIQFQVIKGRDKVIQLPLFYFFKTKIV